MPPAQSMKADLRQAAGGAPDLSPLLGRWVNVHPETDYILRLRAEGGGGSLLIHAYGAGDPEPIDWGEVEATPYVSGGSLEASGFHACYELGPVRTWLAANQKLGILVIQSYTSFADGSGRPAHFSREFFRRED